MERRYGMIMISGTLVEKEPEMLIELFCKIQFLPLSIEQVWEQGNYLYRGYSPLFEKVEEGTLSPTYQVRVTNHYDEEGKITSFDCEVTKDSYYYGSTVRSSIELNRGE